MISAFGVEHGISKSFRGAYQLGQRLAAGGHSLTGPIGSGRFLRPTYEVRPGAKLNTRLGVHAGVASARAPQTAAAAGAGGAGAEAVRRRRKKRE